MISPPYTYPHRRAVTIAGVLALIALGTGVVYEVNSTPLTMVIFLAGGSLLLLAAAVLFCQALWFDVQARLQSLTTKRFARGEVIFRQGDVAEHVYVITKGKIEAVFSDSVKGEIVLGQLGPPDLFGETAILTQSPRQATVRAIEEVDSLMVHRTDFLRLYGNLPRLRAAIEAQQSRRQAMLNGRSK